MEYKLVGADTTYKLEDEVNELLSNGWKLYGSPVFGLDGCGQAMVKDDDETIKPLLQEAEVIDEIANARFDPMDVPSNQKDWSSVRVFAHHVLGILSDGKVVEDEA